MNEVVNSEIVILIRILNPGLKEKGLQSRQGQSSKDKVWKVMNDEI